MLQTCNKSIRFYDLFCNYYFYFSNVYIFSSYFPPFFEVHMRDSKTSSVIVFKSYYVTNLESTYSALKFDKCKMSAVCKHDISLIFCTFLLIFKYCVTLEPLIHQRKSNYLFMT